MKRDTQNDYQLLPVNGEVSEIELYYKSKIKYSNTIKINSSKDAADLFNQYWDQSKIEFVEQFKVLLLNRANKAIGMLTISSGTTTATVVDVKLIFVSAIKCNACGIIVAHNHPSGELKPSQADLKLTRKVSEAGKLLDLPILDHLIISREGHYSFADDGVL